MSATAAWQAAVVSFVVFCLLSSGSLVKTARGQSDGWGRSITLSTARGIDRVSNFFSLNRPLDWVNDALDRTDTEPEVLFPPTTLPAAPVGTTTTTTPPPTISPGRPMLVRLFGDSQGINLGVGLQNATAADPLITAAYDGKVSTGLARPDYYNWPARVLEQLSQQDADVVVLHFGANDHQNLTDIAGNSVAVRGTPEWELEYRRRVAGMMDLVRKDPRRVVWIGNPVVREPGRNATLTLINRIIVEEAALRPWVTYVETADLLDGPNHEYVDYFTPEGRPAIRCRRGDGSHLTVECIELVIDEVLAAIRPIFPVATTTTLPPATTLPPPAGPTTTVP